jgi:hypothetical protein
MAWRRPALPFLYVCGLFTALLTGCESRSIHCDEYKDKTICWNVTPYIPVDKHERIGKNAASIFSVYRWNLAMNKAGSTETSVRIQEYRTAPQPRIR